MKKKKTLFFELEPDEVAHAVMLMVCAKYPEHKEHLKKELS